MTEHKPVWKQTIKHTNESTNEHNKKHLTLTDNSQENHIMTVCST